MALAVDVHVNKQNHKTVVVPVAVVVVAAVVVVVVVVAVVVYFRNPSRLTGGKFHVSDDLILFSFKSRS